MRSEPSVSTFCDSTSQILVHRNRCSNVASSENLDLLVNWKCEVLVEESHNLSRGYVIIKIAH